MAGILEGVLEDDLFLGEGFGFGRVGRNGLRGVERVTG